MQVEFGKIKFKSSTVSRTGSSTVLNPCFDEEIWIPVSMPTVTKKLKFTIYDKDSIRDERVAVVHMDITDLLRFRHGATRWINLYGPNQHKSVATINLSKADGKDISWYDYYLDFSEAAPMFRGRMLLGSRIENKPPKKKESLGLKPFKRRIPRSLPRCANGMGSLKQPTTRTLSLQIQLYVGSAMPKITLVSSVEPMRVGASMGRFQGKNDVAVKNEKGSCVFLDATSNGLIQIHNMEFPADHTQVRRNEIECDIQENVAFLHKYTALMRTFLRIRNVLTLIFI